MPNVSKDVVVRLLTIILTPVVAGATAYAARKGVHLPSADIVTLSVLAGVAVLGAGFHWLQRQPAVLSGELDLERLAGRVSAMVAANPVTAAAVKDLEARVKSQHGEVLDAIAQAVHAPASVENVAKQLADALLTPKPPEPPPAVVSEPPVPLAAVPEPPIPPLPVPDPETGA